MTLLLKMKTLTRQHKGIIKALICVLMLIMIMAGYVIYNFFTMPGSMPSKYKSTLIEDLYTIDTKEFDSIGKEKAIKISNKWLPVGSDASESLNYLFELGFESFAPDEMEDKSVRIILSKKISTNLFTTRIFTVILVVKDAEIESSYVKASVKMH